MQNSISSAFSVAYFETSAANGQNVEKAVDCLLEMVMQRIQTAAEQQQMLLNSSGSAIDLAAGDQNARNCSYC